MATWPDPRSLSTGLAFGSSQYEDPTGLSYETVSPADDPDLGDDPGPVLGVVRIARGRVGDSSETQPTQITTRLRNDSGEFSPRNVSGPRFGTLRKGTPIQAEIDLGAGPVPLARAAVEDFTPARLGPDIDPHVPIQAWGVLARLSRDQTSRSALAFAILHYPASDPDHLVSYWPMESDPAASNAVSGQAPLTITGEVETTSTDVPAGMSSVVVLGTDTQIVGPVSGAFGGAWIVWWMARFPDGAPASSTVLMRIETSALRWELSANSTTLTVTGYSGGSVVVTDSDSGDAFDRLFSGEWVAVYLVVQTNDVEVLVYAPSPPFDNVGFSEAGTFSAGDVTSVTIPSSAELDGVQVGHLFVADGDILPAPLVPALAQNPQTGYADENAVDRIRRLIGQSGIPATLISDADSATMGVQQTTSLLRSLREAEYADEGVLFELRDGRLTFHPQTARYNASVELTLTYGSEESPGDVTDLGMIDDDRDVTNRVTVVVSDGTEATEEVTDGPVGSDTTTGIGPRPLTFSRNITADRAAIHAGYLVNRGTIDKPRYIVALDLYANPALAEAWLDCDISSRIVITGAPEEDHGPDDLDLIIEGSVEEYGADAGFVEAYCETYAPYLTRVLAEDDPGDDNEYVGWLDADSLDLDVGVDADDTSWTVNTVPLCSTSADDVPVNVRIGGELVTVTAISGASSPQTFTVTRSVNGVVKAHDAGAVLVLDQPILLTLT